MIRKEKAITLIALVITIVVLLILAGVTIATLTGDNGILTRASSSKIETAVGAVKEALKLEQGEKRIEEEQLTPETLLAEGKVQRTVQQEDGSYYMYYALKEDAVEGMQGLGKGNIVELKDVFLIDDDLNVKYIATNGKEYGDNINNKILEDETEIRFASKAFSEYISKISGVTEEEMKFKWMKNQTSLTIDDSSITSLEDLVFFPNLKELALNSLVLDNLNGIENCIKMEKFSSNSSEIRDFNKLSNLTNLKKFYNWANNNPENIISSLKNLENLEDVSIRYTTLSSMKLLEKLKTNKLKSLTLDYNQINRIEGLEKFTELEALSLSNNPISTIEGLENLKKLQTLYFSGTSIKDITPLASNSELNFIDLTKNQEIETDKSKYTESQREKLEKLSKILDNNGTIYLDLNKLNLFDNYKKLNLQREEMENLRPLEGMTELEELILSYNNITLEDEESRNILKSMTKLKTLRLDNNKISNITAINELKDLKYLFLQNNSSLQLKQIEDIISNLVEFRISDDTLSTIVYCNPSKIKKARIVACELSKLPDMSVLTNLETLSLSR